MGKVLKAFFVVAGLWVGVEFFTEGPSQAFDGAFASFFKSESAETDTRSTARRAGDSVSRAKIATEERRKKMLGE